MTEFSLDWLNQCTPLWATLVAAFTAPYMWSRYIKKGVKKYLESRFGVEL